MVPVDDDEDDFIVQAVEDTGASDAQQDASWTQYGLKKLGGLVFASKTPSAEEIPVEPEPTLPAGFSATLNAEEEEIYPAEVRITARDGSLLRQHTTAGKRQKAALIHTFSHLRPSCPAAVVFCLAPDLLGRRAWRSN